MSREVIKGIALRVGTILRLPWWSRAPRATVVGFVPRAPSRVRLLGLDGVIRGRVMLVRVDRVERRTKATGSVARDVLTVPCPCGLIGCRGSVRFRDALRLVRRLA